MSEKINLNQRVAAVLLAALDGHNPNIERTPEGKLILHTGRGKSDLDLAVEELITIPADPRFIYRALALEAVHIMQWIAYRHDISHTELVETFQRNLIGHIKATAQDNDNG